MDDETTGPYKGKGWKWEHLHMLQNVTQSSMDAMIFRIPCGWIDPNDVTMKNLEETVSMAIQHLNVKVVVMVVVTWPRLRAVELAWRPPVVGPRPASYREAFPNRVHAFPSPPLRPLAAVLAARRACQGSRRGSHAGGGHGGR